MYFTILNKSIFLFVKFGNIQYNLLRINYLEYIIQQEHMISLNAIKKQNI